MVCRRKPILLEIPISGVISEGKRYSGKLKLFGSFSKNTSINFNFEVRKLENETCQIQIYDSKVYNSITGYPSDFFEKYEVLTADYVLVDGNPCKCIGQMDLSADRYLKSLPRQKPEDPYKEIFIEYFNRKGITMGKWLNDFEQRKEYILHHGYDGVEHFYRKLRPDYIQWCNWNNYKNYDPESEFLSEEQINEIIDEANNIIGKGFKKCALSKMFEHKIPDEFIEAHGFRKFGEYVIIPEDYQVLETPFIEGSIWYPDDEVGTVKTYKLVYLLDNKKKEIIVQDLQKKKIIGRNGQCIFYDIMFYDTEGNLIEKNSSL